MEVPVMKQITTNLLCFCCIFLLLIAAGLLNSTISLVQAQDMEARYYDIGQPTLTDIWVDPISGNDNNNGDTRSLALQTVTAAWNKIPNSTTLTTTGYRIMLVSGTYPENSLPDYWEARFATYQFPIILQAADGAGTAILPSMSVFNCHYFYMIDLQLESHSENVLHLDNCHHVLLRHTQLLGLGDIDSYTCPQEDLKANQSQYLYIEDCDISNAWNVALDFVAVQHGHIVGNRIHGAGDWCIYLKGGSAYLRVEGNEIFNGGTGGFSAGQGTGFQFMVSPWIHYEAYDIKFVNNVIHDIWGAGMGVNGGYNILMAYNTLYRIGERSHILEVSFGSRCCDGQPGDPIRDNCTSYLEAGGWGTTVIDDGSNHVRIPNKNIFFYNNILYNPSGFQSQWQHFAIPGPESGPTQIGANVPIPTLADENLQIRGNIIWNGPPEHPLGIDGESGCQPDNPNCNVAQIHGENIINSIEPQLVDPANGNFRPMASGNVYDVQSFIVPNFPGGDLPQPPLSPAGNLVNDISRDFDRANRPLSGPPGAFVHSTAQAVKKIDGELPKSFELKQNYPNPFNSLTTIEFALGIPGSVTVKVFNMLGEEVALLVDGKFSIGRYKVMWKTNGIITGVYFYRIEVKSGDGNEGSFVDVKKMILVK
ncbi:right-handed parallel beta-helix repeat-containing protein [candidate division KSB1 bacterium]|nr:right-handed parallel beta-helix repeat-containing protein [candidate division KSB1 bacterium]